MDLSPHQYYHIYNRSNNSEIVFKAREDYYLFLEKYKAYLETLLDTIAYCLMPTHFHFLIYIKSEDIEKVRKNVGILLSSYTTKTNLVYRRHGSLFQRHTKAKLVDDEDYLVTLLTYIHQNPVRAGLVKSIEDWEFSSYRDLISVGHHESRPKLKKEIIKEYFSSIEDFEKYSKATIEAIRKEYWI